MNRHNSKIVNCHQIYSLNDTCYHYVLIFPASFALRNSLYVKSNKKFLRKDRAVLHIINTRDEAVTRSVHATRIDNTKIGNAGGTTCFFVLAISRSRLSRG